MENENKWPKFGTVGIILLAAYLLLVGISLLIGGTAIPGWAVGALAVSAGILILVGK